MFVSPARRARRVAWLPLALAAFLLARVALAQPLKLKSTPALSEALPPEGLALPSTVRGERMTGSPGRSVRIEGNAEWRRAGMTLRSRRLDYDERHDIATASGGSVLLNHAGDHYQGSSGRLQADAHEGVVLNPSYTLHTSGAYGTAQRLDILDAERARIWHGTYTTCDTCNALFSCRRKDARPDWVLRAGQLDVDSEEADGHVKGASLEFKGARVPLPPFSFPLNDARRSGWLAPTVGLDNKSGPNLIVPYYWDIAPNRDATFWPHVMARRGVDLGGQFRYLERRYNGRINLHYMPHDRLRDRDRWAYFFRHNGRIVTGLRSVGDLGLSLNLNRVSDGNHWRDFSTRGSVLNTERQLVRSGALTWGRYGFSLYASAVKWQAQQSTGDNRVNPAYDRLPQFGGGYSRSNHNGFDYSAAFNFSRFRKGQRISRSYDADRMFIHAQVARPFEASWGYITPKLQLHSAYYSFRDARANTTDKHEQRSVPTVSVDSGLFFDRDARILGRSFQHTLEPRLKYTYTPYRDQSSIPNYDAGLYDFNFATIWQENAFSGHDRISDNNQITAGVTTRLLDAGTGAEALRLAAAQRFRFAPQRVTLGSGGGEDKGWSDLMLGANINWTPTWSFGGTTQYDTHTRHSSRSSMRLRYMPGPYRMLSFAYRWHRSWRDSEYVDVAWQWPLWRPKGLRGELGSSSSGTCGSGWYTVGRLNYSRTDSRLVDGILGVEYDAGCWIGRLVMEKLSTSRTSSTKRLLFQIELRGLARVGNNPLASLRNHIPRYRTLGSEEENAPVPSRFSQYE